MKPISAVSSLLVFFLFAVHVALGAGLGQDVRSSGAVGDGKTDDTAAIQRAVNAGGPIYFSRGTFRLTKPVVIELDKTGFVSLLGDGTARVLMAGAGPAFKFVGTHEGSAAPSEFKPNVWERQRMPLVDGLAITGEHPEADGIKATGTMQLTITRTHIRGVRHAIHLTVRNRNVLISDCHLYENRGVGVFLDNLNLHQINITGSHISYNAGGGVVSRGGNVRNLQIGNCDIESNMSSNSPPTANVLLDSTGGHIGEVAITGCTIQHNSTSPDSANIRVLGRGTDTALARRTGSERTQEGHITITGNIFSDVRVNVHLKDARGVTLTGNTFWMGYDCDLVVEDSSHIVVGSNNFDRNPRYNYGDSLTAKGGLVFRNSRDCTLNGLSVSGVERQPAAVLLENCDRFLIASGSILDCDNVGLMLKNVTRSRVSNMLIRDDRAGAPAFQPLVVSGGSQLQLEANSKH